MLFLVINRYTCQILYVNLISLVYEQFYNFNLWFRIVKRTFTTHYYQDNYLNRDFKHSYMTEDAFVPKYLYLIHNVSE